MTTAGDEKTPLLKVAETQRFPWKILFTTIILSSGGSFILGLSCTLLNPVEFLLKEFINQSYVRHYNKEMPDTFYNFLWPLTLNLLPIGFLLGAALLVKLTENFGRRRTFYVSVTLITVGLSFQALAYSCSSFELLGIGRLVTAVGSGISPLLEAMYYNEISPLHLRGFFCSITGISLELGLVIGCVLPLSTVLGTEELLPWMFAVQIIPCLCAVMLLPYLPESPRHLLGCGRVEECRRSLKFFGHTKIEAVIKEIESDLGSQLDLVTQRELYRKPHLRRALFLSLLINLQVVLCGITAVEFYSTGILVNVGLSISNAQYALVAIMAPSFLAAIFGSYLVERCGRRILLLVSTASLIFCNATLMIMTMIFDAYRAAWAGYVSVLACIILVISFATGPSLLQWFVPVEIVPQNARSAVQTTVNIWKNIAYFMAGVAFYPLQKAVGAYCFLLAIIPLLIFFIIFALAFPETKKATVVDVMKNLGYDAENNEVVSLKLAH